MRKQIKIHIFYSKHINKPKKVFQTHHISIPKLNILVVYMFDIQSFINVDMHITYHAINKA